MFDVERRPATCFGGIWAAANNSKKCDNGSNYNGMLRCFYFTDVSGAADEIKGIINLLSLSSAYLGGMCGENPWKSSNPHGLLLYVSLTFPGKDWHTFSKIQKIP